MVEGDGYQLMGEQSRVAESMLVHNTLLRSFFDEMVFSRNAQIHLEEVFM